MYRCTEPFRVEGPQNYARRQRGASGSSRRMVTGDEPAVAGTELGASARVTVKEVPSAAVARRRREGRAGRQGANGSGSRERGGYAARGARRQQGQHGVSGGSASGDADGEVHSGSDAWSAHEQPRRGAAAAAAGGAHGRRGNGESQEKSSQATRAGVAPRPARRSGAAAQRGGRPKPNLADLHSVLDDIESPRRQRDAEAAGGGSTRARGGRVGRASPISAGDARFDRGSDVDDARFGDMGPPPDMGEDFSGGVAALVRDADFGLGAGGDGTASDDDEVSAPAGAAVRGGAVRSRREGTRGRERPRQGVPHPAAGARVEGAYGGGHGGGYVAAHSQPPAVAMPSPGYSTVGAPSSYVGPGGVTYVVDAATGAMVPMAPAMGAPVAQQPPTRKPQRPDGGAKRGSGARGGRRGVHAGSPGRGGDIGDGPFRSLAHQQKESHAFAEGEVSRDEINEARVSVLPACVCHAVLTSGLADGMQVKSEEEKLYFSRHGRSVDYKPKTLSSYRKNAPKGYYELGTLGSDLNTDELVAKVSVLATQPLEPRSNEAATSNAESKTSTNEGVRAAAKRG